MSHSIPQCLAIQHLEGEQNFFVFYKLKSAHFIIEKVPTLKKPTLKLLSKRVPLYYRKVAHFCPPHRAGDKISITQ
jgi:hypothetical protein